MRALFFALFGAVTLAALWFFLAPTAPHASAQHASVDQPMSAVQSIHADYSWQISTGEIIGPQQIELPVGERVLLSVSSDVADEIHLHGYEQVLSVPAGGEATLTVTLEHSGRFELESHASHRLLSVLVVEPRP